jgi:hypothetical protein
MRDEVAVRHLIQQARGFPETAHFLGAMDIPEAVVALKDLLFDRDREIASRAREALTEMKNTSKSDAVQKAAQAALSPP